jgi:small subunit ribosomal protein S17e
MGRIRTNFIKSLSSNLVEVYPEKFGTNFDENKKALNELKLFDEKFTRNKVAGYIVRVVMKKKL